VIIIHRGKVLASDAPENLMKTLHAGGVIRAELRGPAAEIQLVLPTIPGVASATVEAGEDALVQAIIEPQPGADPREAIFAAAVQHQWTLRELSRSRTSLEDIFVHVTREEDEAEEDRRDQKRSLLR
jgi:ABC-2 type transport system ATP-binding protein